MTSYTAPGAWIDDRVPDELAGLLDGIEIDPAAFSAWLAERLAALRFQREIRSQLPTRTDEVEALRDYVAALAAVAKFQPGGLPPKAQTFLATEGLHAGTPWHDAARKFQFDAIELHAIAARALSRAEQMPAPARGRPKGRENLRDELLADVVARLNEAGATRHRARQLAEQILVLAGIPAPEGERSIRRATGRVQGGKK